jgi:hypothetical protein
MRNASNYRLTVELEHQAKHTVRCRVLRADVDEHVVAGKLRLDGLRRRNVYRGTAIVCYEWNALRFSLRIQTGRRELDFNRAIA